MLLLCAFVSNGLDIERLCRCAWLRGLWFERLKRAFVASLGELGFRCIWFCVLGGAQSVDLNLKVVVADCIRRENLSLFGIGQLTHELLYRL